MATTLALGGLIFLVLPRRAGATRTQSAAPMSRHLTGFDEEVQLGQLGEILENDSVVMTVELTDDDDKAIRPVEEPLWRGVTMLRYEKGRWHRQSKPTQTVVSFQRQTRARVRKRIHQKITLEPNDSATLVRHPSHARCAVAPHRFSPNLSTNDGTLFRADSRSGEYEYEVISDSDPDGFQPHESPPRETDKQVLSVPAELRPGCDKSPSRWSRRSTPAGPGRQSGPRPQTRVLPSRLRPVQLHLADGCQRPESRPGRRLSRQPQERTLRVFRQCTGAFAPCLSNIPSRVVNGFKGGDWNELTETMNVRQKHAHSWVEAYIGLTPGTDRAPIWITLDPTPASERQESIAHVGGLAGTSAR